MATKKNITPKKPVKSTSKKPHPAIVKKTQKNKPKITPVIVQKISHLMDNNTTPSNDIISKSSFVAAKDKFVSFMKGFKITPLYLILIITAVIMIVGYIWFYDPTVRNERNRLKKENKELQKQRKLVADSLRALEVDYVALQIQDSMKAEQIIEINSDIEFIKQSVKNSSNNLNQIKNRLNTTNAEIGSNKNAPPKKGDKLLISLKDKVNQKN